MAMTRKMAAVRSQKVGHSEELLRAERRSRTHVTNATAVATR
jgi:hypothetical protein